MKINFKKILKNFIYSLSSNLISLIISALVVLIVPKIIGIEDYGFWQLYLFYSSYIGFLHFGWNDGIYLRYGGKKYAELNKPLFFSQFHTLFFTQVVFALIIFVISLLRIDETNRSFIWQMISIEIIVVNTRYMLTHILQATNRIKDYSKVIIFDRLIYLILISFLLLKGISDFKLLVLADIIGKTVSFIYATYLCKDIVFRKVTEFKNSSYETIININAGIKLMISNIANTLIIGIVRFGIERTWSVSVFGKVSLTLSVSNMFMMFIGALGLVIYPILRRVDQNSLPKIYSIMRDILMTLVLALLVLYMPVKTILSLWLPQYNESLNYMGLLFPIVIYQSKMSLLINTYMKTLRLENKLMYVNVVTTILSLGITFINTTLIKSLDLTILSILLLIVFRGIISELILSKIQENKVLKDIFLELILTCIFVYTSWIINTWFSTVIYTCSFMFYLFIKKNDIRKSIGALRKMVAS